MNSAEFEKHIQDTLDKRFSVKENPNRPGLSNIYFDGKNYDLPPIPTGEIKDKPDQSYRFEFPNGMSARFWSMEDIVPRLQDFLKKIDSGGSEDYE